MQPLTSRWHNDVPYLSVSYAHILLRAPNHESFPAYADEHSGFRKSYVIQLQLGT